MAAFEMMSSKFRGLALSNASGLPMTSFSNLISLWANGTVGACWVKAVAEAKRKATIVRTLVNTFICFPPLFAQSVVNRNES
jgi:hypothetical protein